MKYGLSEEQLAEIIAFLKRYPEVEQAILFGSRAMDTYKEASDIDIAIKGEKVNAGLAATIKFDLEEDTYLPFFFDVIAYPTITNQALIAHIDNKGVRLFGGDEWQLVSLSAVAEINPSESLKKGVLAKKIGMDVILPFTKKPMSFSLEEFNGGMKFRNGDTLVARITPCLENGKTAYIDVLNAGEVGFGSTEYIVLRERIGLSDKQFLYYFAISPIFREVAILSMTGSSGRQRVQTDVVKDYLFDIPSLPEQKAIANVLSSLDDKIDLLHRQNKTLEAMAETLFRQWFIEEAQDDWEEVRLSDLCSVITKGTTPTTMGHNFVENGINFIKAEAISDDGAFITQKFSKISEEAYFLLKRSIIENKDVLCSIAGTIGRVAIVEDFVLPANTNQAVAILRPKKDIVFPEFIYLFLKSALFRDTMDGKVVHAVQPNLSLGEIGTTTLNIASKTVLQNAKAVIQPIFEKKKQNYLQIQTLEKLRDTLLPKLMSGEVRVAYDQQDAA